MDRERTRRSVVERRWKLLPPLREADGRGGCRALRDGRALRQGGPPPPPPRCSSRSARGLTLTRGLTRARGLTLTASRLFPALPLSSAHVPHAPPTAACAAPRTAVRAVGAGP